MSKHYRMRPGKFSLRFEPAEKATVHGGQLAIAAVLEKFNLKKRVKAQRALDPRSSKGKGYDPVVYVAGLVFALTSGGCSLLEVEALNEDEALKSFLGIERFPDESSVGEWLRNVGEAGVEAVRRIVRDFVAWAFERADGARYLHAGQLECFFDDTQLEVYGRTFEGARINYEGKLALGWQTLWVGPFLVDGVLGAPGDVSSELRPLLEANRSLWKKEASYLYADSGSSAGSYLAAIEEHFAHWSVSYNKWTEPLERQAREFPETYWSRPVEVRGRKGEMETEQYAWLRYQPEGCESPRRFAVARRRGPQDLFWSYGFVTTHEQEGAAQAVFERHHLKGEMERRFSEVLSDMDLHHPPCASLSANRVYYALAMLAYNVLQALKVIWLPVTEQSRRVRTLVHRLLLIPVRIQRHARRLAARFYVPAHGLAWWQTFFREMLPRCGLAPPRAVIA